MDFVNAFMETVKAQPLHAAALVALGYYLHMRGVGKSYFDKVSVPPTNPPDKPKEGDK